MSSGWGFPLSEADWLKDCFIEFGGGAKISIYLTSKKNPRIILSMFSCFCVGNILKAMGFHQT